MDNILIYKDKQFKVVKEDFKGDCKFCVCFPKHPSFVCDSELRNLFWEKFGRCDENRTKLIEYDK